MKSAHLSISAHRIRRPQVRLDTGREERRMKFLMFVCWDAKNMDAQAEPDPANPPEEESFPWLDDLQAQGIWVLGEQLAPPRRGRSVRVRDGKALVIDGPFAE